MTIFFPGTDGGAQWGGAAVDPKGIMYVPAKEIPVYSTLIKKEKTTSAAVSGARLYSAHCASCHGKDRRGNHDGSIPSLITIDKRSNSGAVSQILDKGKGMMPSYSHLPQNQREAITDFLFNRSGVSSKSSVAKGGYSSPYQHTGYNRWYDRNGYPVVTPPWGTLTAIDMNTGERKWQIALGEYPELMKKGMAATGTDNYGGPLVTASGILFIGATRDEKFRAMNMQDGKIIWETVLPAAGYASPSTYSVNGKQYIVIACGGGKLGTKSSDKYVAFAIDND
jgi:quinoprotein glucose dehydrogenase